MKKKSFIKTIAEAILPIFFIILFFYKSLFNTISNYLIDNYGSTIQGYITTEEYTFTNSRVVKRDSYSSGYEFIIDNKTYKGNSHQNKLSVGSPIEIEYYSEYPSINRKKNK
jgi:hypothetical protein